jgi:hypothetical protein
MKVSLITPTGGRPLAFELCEKWMERQTRQPDEWIVVDDYIVPTECKMNQKVIIRKPFWQSNKDITLQKNLIEAMKVVTGDLILIIEDDDWYHPDYIKNMVKQIKKPVFENDSFPHLIGAAFSRYYNIKNYSYKIYNNIHHTSLCQTGFSNKLIPQVNVLAQFFQKETWFDSKLWSLSKCKKLIFNVRLPWTIGIKGLPGRPGAGSGHLRKMSFIDEEPFSVLREWIGKEDTEVYRQKLTHEYEKNNKTK